MPRESTAVLPSSSWHPPEKHQAILRFRPPGRSTTGSDYWWGTHSRCCPLSLPTRQADRRRTPSPQGCHTGASAREFTSTSLLRYFGFAPDTSITVAVFTGVGPLLLAEQQLIAALEDESARYLMVDIYTMKASPLRSTPTSPRHRPARVHAVRTRLRRQITGGIGEPTIVTSANVSLQQALSAARVGEVSGHKLVSFSELGTFSLEIHGGRRSVTGRRCRFLLGRRRRVSCGDAGFHGPGGGCSFLGLSGREAGGQGIARTRLKVSANCCAQGQVSGIRRISMREWLTRRQRCAAAGSAAWPAPPWPAARRAAAAASSTAGRSRSRPRSPTRC